MNNLVPAYSVLSLSVLATETLVDQGLRLAERCGLILEQASHPPGMVETRDNLEFQYVFATNEQGFRNGWTLPTRQRSPLANIGKGAAKNWLTGERKIEELLRHFMYEEAVTFLDLTPELRTATLGDGLPLNFRYDEHFTTTGHQVTAEVLEKWFTRDRVFSFIQ